MNVRLVVCIGAVIGILWCIRRALYVAFDAVGFWPYMLLCGGLVAIIIGAAFAWDRYEVRQRQSFQEGPPSRR